MSRRVLVAGIGNIFLGDDGFGVEVAQRLAREPLPEGARVVDFGIRGVHLAYELLNEYDAAILIDATPRGGAPGTLYVLEPELASLDRTTDTQGHASAARGPVMDAHGMAPDAVLGLLRSLGGTRARILLVGCEPATLEEGIVLSAPVAGAVSEAVDIVRELVERMLGGADLPADLVDNLGSVDTHGPLTTMDRNVLGRKAEG